MDYIEAFRNLRTNNKYRRKSPHKAILLLAIIEMFEKNILLTNEIRYNNKLKDVFHEVWNRTLPNEAIFLPDAYLPFWYMQSEGFWHIVPLRGKEDILALLRDNHVKPSESKLSDCVNYAELDEDLYFMITMPSGRKALKKALLETYSSLSDSQIEVMSESLDNSVDYSASAIEQYNEILNTPAKETRVKTVFADNSLQEMFERLGEDIQIVMNIEYFKFLKNNRQERELFKELCPSVYHLYERIAVTPIRRDELHPSIVSLYETFLSDLKISLMGEEDSFDLIDKINDALQVFSNVEKQTETTDYVCESTVESCERNIADYYSSNDVLSTLQPSQEQRNGMPWTNEEERKISTYFKMGYSPEEISSTIGRSEIAIKIRLANLGLMDYVYGESIEHTKDVLTEEDTIPIGFYVENGPTRASIMNMQGECEFSVSGKLKIFHGMVFRFNYKSMCLTVKDIMKSGGEWYRGEKRLVSYTDSDLYPLLNKENYIEHVEDLIVFPNWKDNKIRFDGKWYDFNGFYIEDAEEELPDNVDATSLHVNSDAFDYIPPGKLSEIEKVIKCSYDFLWTMAIIDLLELQQSSTLSFDNLACMMIANAWDLLCQNEELRCKTQTLTECIEFLIDESKEYMDDELAWSTPKNKVYEIIKDYPMAGVFEETVDELIESSPYNILEVWLPDADGMSIISLSQQFENNCLYALHPRKIDPYIEVMPKFFRSLVHEHDNLVKYFGIKYIEFVNT